MQRWVRAGTAGCCLLVCDKPGTGEGVQGTAGHDLCHKLWVLACPRLQLPSREACLPQVSFVSAKSAGRGPDMEIDAADLSAHLAARYAGQVLTTGQEITFEYQVSGCWGPVAVRG